MKRILAATLSLVPFACARAQDAPAWDCWVDDLSPPVLVRCIHDRDPGSPPSEELEDEAERLALDRIHRYLHSDGRAASAEARRDISLLREGRLWTITIHIHPFGPQRVEELVRSLLCLPGVLCRVSIGEK